MGIDHTPNKTNKRNLIGKDVTPDIAQVIIDQAVRDNVPLMVFTDKVTGEVYMIVKYESEH